MTDALAGLFVPRAGTTGALASTLCGVAVVVLTQFVHRPGPSWMTPAVWGMLAAVIAMAVALAVMPPRQAAAEA